jgi:hypothetical protein
MNIHADKDYWTGLTWPAAPNTADYQYLKATVRAEFYC